MLVMVTGAFVRFNPEIGHLDITEEDHEYAEVDETTVTGIELIADYCVRFAKSAGITTEQLINMVADAAKEREG